MPADSIRYFRLPVTGIDAMNASTARAFPRHTHDLYGIGRVEAGGHASWSGRGKVEAGPGTYITTNPGEVHDGMAVGGTPRSWRILYFEPGALGALLADVNEGAGREYEFSAPVFDDGALREVFDRAFSFATADARAGAEAALACESALLVLAARLRGHGDGARARPGIAAPVVTRARARIDADPAAPHALTTLARDCGVSRFQLMRGFARATGLTPHAYIVQQRLALARRLIRAGGDLAQVALDAGFCDQSHLARCFTRQFGVPPRRYAAAG
ncbi:MAG TPA: AraC family transcriptional regulator [Steroidobacteraceae bacterium]|nr:AraC family transcriptional regulator [Steroidobacteraceae bacterium]